MAGSVWQAVLLVAVVVCVCAGPAAGKGPPGPCAGPLCAPTCSPQSPAQEHKLPFCNRSLGFRARVQDLVTRLNTTEQLNLFGHSYPGSEYVERLNLKGWGLDHTCVHGINHATGVSVFPMPIALGATWDRDLVRRVGNATAVEARTLTQWSYRERGGTVYSTLSCDGGPLANTAHDPRWGRISETYSEDPYHAAQMGLAATLSLQNAQPVPGGHPSDVFMAIRTVVRHYLGYHSARPDFNPPYMNVTARNLFDAYLPVYKALLTNGSAEGLMCSHAGVNIQHLPGVNPGPVPSCANKYLLGKVLEDWGVSPLVQSDCCDSIASINQPWHYDNTTNDAEALVLALAAGVQVYYGYRVQEFLDLFGQLLANNTVSAATLQAASARVLLAQMRLGLFDPDNPFSEVDESRIDGPAHRLLAREAAAKSMVLLKNQDSFLPLTKSSLPDKLAVIGPFGDCANSPNSCYYHSYNGVSSNVTSVYAGIKALATNLSSSSSVSYALGCNATCPTTRGAPAECWLNQTSPINASLAAAVQLAAESDLTFLVVGLGSEVEAEGRDRMNMTLPHLQARLYDLISRAARDLVVVVVSAGGVDLDESAASAVVQAWYGGEEVGSGLADVIGGAVNPSGRLPLTVYKQAWSSTMNARPDLGIANFNLEATENSLGRTYRYLKDPAANAGHFFGFGLSYTNFTYSEAKAQPLLSTGLVNVTFGVQNTGAVFGEEVSQVYVQLPQSSAGTPSVLPNLSLVAFTKLPLHPGQKQTVTLSVLVEQLQTVMDDGSSTLQAGTYKGWVSGHQPADSEGQQNVATFQFDI